LFKRLKIHKNKLGVLEPFGNSFEWVLKCKFVINTLFKRLKIHKNKLGVSEPFRNSFEWVLNEFWIAKQLS